MSYQPQAPPTYQQPPPPPVVAPAAPKGKRHTGLMIFGLIVLIAGFVGGGLMVMKSTSNYKDSVKSLARAPVGCTTTLVFDKLGTFTIYIETKGKVADLSGGCEGSGSDYTHSGDKLPRVSLTLTNATGDEIDLARGATGSYDVGGYKGEAYRTVKIEDAGTYRLDVQSDDTDFAMSIGKNPKKDSDQLKTIGGGVVLVGLILGLTFFLIGLRRRPVAAAPAAPAPWPAAYSPMPPGPPTERHPGYRAEPVPPGPPPALSGQPPLRLPDQPSGGFAPPTVVPPPPPPPVSPPPPPSTGWVPPEEDDE